MSFEIDRNGNQLLSNGSVVLSSLNPNIQLQYAASEEGAFLKFQTEKPASRIVMTIGIIPNLMRFTACNRYEPFWMRPKAGEKISEIPIETQYLLVEMENGDCLLLVPLIDGAFRCSIQGREDGGLELVAESADPATITSHVVGLYINGGEDPYELIPHSAEIVNKWMGIGRLRREKPLPEFIDYFGWCTWDAFYHDVSHDNLRTGLESFREGGVQPKYLILDDGWQSEITASTGEKRLSSFDASGKFPEGLKATVKMSKEMYDIETFLVWHTITGYWGGVDGNSLGGYGVRSVQRNNSEGIHHYSPSIETWWGEIMGLVPPEQAHHFFNDYHRFLRESGVDGVKVDNQGVLESVAYGYGGRVEMMRRFHEALEGSVHVHFSGNLINCMSCPNEMLYCALSSNLTRTSTDFWPKQPASHGLHLYTNAQVSMWFGEFIHPDWDMFQSGHPMGAFHAAGRAVGGCPIYVSDKPDAHDFDLLRKLVFEDGGIPRCENPGRPTRDCLFHDPTKEDVLLKIFNRNSHSSVIAVFNAHFWENTDEAHEIKGAIRPHDAIPDEAELYAVYSHQTRELRLMRLNEEWKISLPQLSFDIFTITPVINGFAPVGLIDMFNSGGAIIAGMWDEEKESVLYIQGPGRFVSWSETRPEKIMLNGNPVPFQYDKDRHWLEFQANAGELVVLFDDVSQ